jgi:hypothetical protein
MTTLLLTIMLVGLVMVAMAVGVMVSGRRLRGSCGGVGGAGCHCRADGIEPGSCDLTEQAIDSPGS